jgi:hypothetical protein
MHSGVRKDTCVCECVCVCVIKRCGEKKWETHTKQVGLLNKEKALKQRGKRIRKVDTWHDSMTQCRLSPVVESLQHWESKSERPLLELLFGEKMVWSYQMWHCQSIWKRQLRTAIRWKVF